MEEVFQGDLRQLFDAGIGPPVNSCGEKSEAEPHGRLVREVQQRDIYRGYRRDTGLIKTENRLQIRSRAT
jgi:hypothetical protein